MAFSQMSRYFIVQMEHKLKKIKRPSKGLIWYIIMWAITLISAFLVGYLREQITGINSMREFESLRNSIFTNSHVYRIDIFVPLRLVANKYLPKRYRD